MAHLSMLEASRTTLSSLGSTLLRTAIMLRRIKAVAVDMEDKRRRTREEAFKGDQEADIVVASEEDVVRADIDALAHVGKSAHWCFGRY
jgi:hypothetical protein